MYSRRYVSIRSDTLRYVVCSPHSFNTYTSPLLVAMRWWSQSSCALHWKTECVLPFPGLLAHFHFWSPEDLSFLTASAKVVLLGTFKTIVQIKRWRGAAVVSDIVPVILGRYPSFHIRYHLLSNQIQKLVQNSQNSPILVRVRY